MVGATSRRPGPGCWLRLRQVVLVPVGSSRVRGFVAGSLVTSWAWMGYVTSLIRTYPVTMGEWGSHSHERRLPVGSSAGRSWMTSRGSIATSITRLHPGL